EADLRAEVAGIFDQIQSLFNDTTPWSKLTPAQREQRLNQVLTPEQKDRLLAADVFARGKRLVGDMDMTVRTLRNGQFDDAGERQRRHAKELKDLAAALRSPPASRLDALKDAAQKLERAIDAQTKVNNDSTQKPTPEEIDKARRSKLDPEVVKGNELANQQAKAELSAYDARKAANQADVPEAVNKLNDASNNQFDSEKALRDGKADNARQPQDKALDDLKAAKAEIDRQIAAAELAKADPLAAVKQAAERVEKLIQDQKDTNAKTQKA